MSRPLAGLGLLFLTVGLSAWQWPVESPVVIGTFGQRTGDTILRGVELRSSATDVTAVERGVVVAARSEFDRPPSGLGAFVALEHDQGLLSIYAHLDSEHLPVVGAVVEAGETIGRVGGSGPMVVRAVRLLIFDRVRQRYVNPLLLLPDLVDRVRPTVEAVYASDGDAFYNLAERSELPAGSYLISARVFDRTTAAASASRLAPYRVTLRVDGEEHFRLTADHATTSGGVTALGPATADRAAAADPDGLVAMSRVDIGPGDRSLELTVRDFAGNETMYRVVVRGGGDR